MSNEKKGDKIARVTSFYIIKPSEGSGCYISAEFGHDGKTLSAPAEKGAHALDKRQRWPFFWTSKNLFRTLFF
jgi:hypothetical protein